MEIKPVKFNRLSKSPLKVDKGKALDETTRAKMEAILGHNLRDVRIHQTGQAGKIASRLGAEAFTIGAHVFSEEGALTSPFKHSTGLLAHELTHVIQQTRPKSLSANSAPVKPPDNPGFTQINAPQKNIPGFSPAVAGNTSAERMETEAIRQEGSARRRAENTARNAPAEIDTEQIADLVYRLMQTEILVEKDRMRR